MAMDHDTSPSWSLPTFFILFISLFVAPCLHTIFSFFSLFQHCSSEVFDGVPKVDTFMLGFCNISSVEMGVCFWFKKISRNKRKKEITPIKLKIQPDSFNLKGIKNGYLVENKSCVSSREVVGLSIRTKELAAIRIQSAFRAYKARKKLRYLKGISRSPDSLTQQASSALERLHFWSKIQAEINHRRLFMVTQGQLKQMKLEERLKVESKLHEFETKCRDPKMMLEAESKIQRREGATNKRERALAYAFCHQWRAKSIRYFGQAYYDLSKESWGWNWIERWIAVYRLEAHVIVRPIVSQRTAQRNKSSETTKMMVAVKRQMGTGKSFNM